MLGFQTQSQGQPPVANAAAAVKKSGKPAKIPASLNPIRDAQFGYEQARHLLWRAGFGGTPQQIQTLASWGPEKAVDYMLGVEKVAFENPKADLFDKGIMRPPSEEDRMAYRMAQRSQDEDAVAKFRKMRMDAERADRRQIVDIQKWWLKRMIETPRPLEEKMVLFWHGHFATNYRTIENSYHMFLQNEMFRRNALGNFGDLLFAIIRDPAMISYLDNNDSRKGKANENLAREIMELFSLGVGNYTEKDIKEGARALTGYTFSDDVFVFQKNNHDDGKKTIFGKTAAMDGDDFVRAILEQRAASMFVVRKLYSYFAKELPPLERLPDSELDQPTASVLNGLSQTFLAARYDLKPVLRKLFLSEHFYATSLMNEQIKSPVQLVVGAMRSLNTPARDLSILNDALDLMGQNLFFPPSVKGWEGGRSWINTSTMFVRQNIMAYLLTGKKPQGYDPTADTQKFDPQPLLEELAKADAAAATDPARVTDYLMKLCLGQTPSHGREAVLSFLSERGNQITPDIETAVLLLITAMPEYQLC